MQDRTDSTTAVASQMRDVLVSYRELAGRNPPYSVVDTLVTHSLKENNISDTYTYRYDKCDPLTSSQCSTALFLWP